MSTPFNHEDLEYEALEDACEKYDTDNPTVEQVMECYQNLLEKMQDEAMNYHDQDGSEREI